MTRHMGEEEYKKLEEIRIIYYQLRKAMEKAGIKQWRLVLPASLHYLWCDEPLWFCQKPQHCFRDTTVRFK